MFQTSFSSRRIRAVLGGFGVALSLGSVIRIAAAPPQNSSERSLRGPVASLDQLEGNRCHRFRLLARGSGPLEQREAPARLGWTTSGIWEGASLLLLDQLEQLVSVPLGGFAASADFAGDPIYLSARSDGSYLILGTDSGSGRLSVVKGAVTQDFFRSQEGGDTALRGMALRDDYSAEYTLTGVFQVASMDAADGQRGVLALADLKDPQGNSRTDFLFLHPSDPRYQPFHVVRNNSLLQDLRRSFYTKDLNFIASIGDAGFILLLGEKPQIVRANYGESDVSVWNFPGGFETPTVDVVYQSRAEFIEQSFSVYQAVEASRMVTGIYSWKERLFVLTKEAADPDTGFTDWNLYEISPRIGRLLRGPIALPTKAPSLTLVPGDSFWAIIEKGEIAKDTKNHYRPVLYRPAQSVSLMPTSWLSSRSGENRPFSDEVCRIIAVDDLAGR